jgi:hypothetical protein
VAPHSKRSRAKSRKRRRATAAVAGAAGGAPAGSAASAPRAEAQSKSAASAPRAKRARSRRAAPRPRGGTGGLASLAPVGKRPPPPWHPLPLSEILIVVGAIGAVVGLSRGVSHGGPPLLAGLAAVIIGTAEVTLREHLSGYRSHTIILAALPVVVLDVVLALLLSPSAPVRFVILVLDAALFASLYRLLRARFLDARRERVFSGR